MAEIIELAPRQVSEESKFRKDLEKEMTEFTPEAVEWMSADMYPRVKNLSRSWEAIPFGKDAASQAKEKVIDDLVRGCMFQILRLEHELYEARFGKSALRE